MTDPGTGTPAQSDSTTTTETLSPGEWYLLSGTGDDAIYMALAQNGGLWVVTSVESNPVYDYLGSVTDGQFTPSEWFQTDEASDAADAEPPQAVPEPADPREFPEAAPPPRKVPPPIILGPPEPSPPRASISYEIGADGSFIIRITPPPGKGLPIKVTFPPRQPGQPGHMIIDNGSGPLDIILPQQ